MFCTCNLGPGRILTFGDCPTASKVRLFQKLLWLFNVCDTSVDAGVIPTIFFQILASCSTCTPTVRKTAALARIIKRMSRYVEVMTRQLGLMTAFQSRICCSSKITCPRAPPLLQQPGSYLDNGYVMSDIAVILKKSPQKKGSHDYVSR
jgi:hypothetical protein